MFEVVVAVLLCGLLGWKRLRFVGWPAAIIGATLMFGLATSWRASSAAYITTAEVFQTRFKLAVLPLLAYVLVSFIRGALDRTRNLPPD
jgi:hypothetical protein